MSHKQLKLVFIPILFIYLINLFIAPFEIDAAQYAEMSREMLKSDHWLHLFDGGYDYLDKPPFLFWISALSMKIFGVSNFAYKLPSTLFAIGSIYCLYRFSKLWYNEKTSLYAALILACSQAVFLIINDIRTDTILMSFVIASFWQMSSWLQQKNNWGWLWAAVCIGGGMITKGPVALIVFGMGMLPHFIIKKQWNNLFRWQYLGMLVVVGIILLPMSYGLYTQFDLHPEKLVNHAQGVSGLNFYYWTQSFGRITGESVWDNNAPFYFLYMNLLWGLLPFTLFFIAATVKGFLRLKENNIQTEWMSTAAVVLAYLSLGISKFQLPHYIYVILPFICLLVARYIRSIEDYFTHKFRIMRFIHIGLFYVIAACFTIGLLYVFPNANLLQKAVVILSSLGIVACIQLNNKKKLQVVPMLVLIAVCYNLSLSFFFYPNLLSYQQEDKIAQVLHEQHLATKEIVTFKYPVGRALDFNLRKDVQKFKTLDSIRHGQIVITDSIGKAKLAQNNMDAKIIYSGLNYPIALIQIGFLSPTSRASYCSKYYLLEMN